MEGNNKCKISIKNKLQRLFLTKRKDSSLRKFHKIDKSQEKLINKKRKLKWLGWEIVTDHTDTVVVGNAMRDFVPALLIREMTTVYKNLHSWGTGSVEFSACCLSVGTWVQTPAPMDIIEAGYYVSVILALGRWTQGLLVAWCQLV